MIDWWQMSSRYRSIHQTLRRRRSCNRWSCTIFPSSLYTVWPHSHWNKLWDNKTSYILVTFDKNKWLWSECTPSFVTQSDSLWSGFPFIVLNLQDIHSLHSIFNISIHCTQSSIFPFIALNLQDIHSLYSIFNISIHCTQSSRYPFIALNLQYFHSLYSIFKISIHCTQSSIFPFLLQYYSIFCNSVSDL